METAFNQFWHLVSGAFALNPEVFDQINTLPDGLTVALIIVLIAGLSQAIGQCIVLFANKVTPIRFFLSLGISAIVFALSYGLWAGSIWIASNLFFDISLSFDLIFKTLGLSYAPQMLGFLIALPYMGIAIGVLLSIWSLLAQFVGLESVAGFEDWSVFICTLIGWVVLQIVQRTIGRPILAFSRWLSNSVAGTSLITDPKKLEEMVMYDGNEPQILTVGKEIWLEAEQQEDIPKQKTSSTVKFVALALLGLLLVFILYPNSNNPLTIGFSLLNHSFRLGLKLVNFSLIALLISIVLTPLESLTWWAGWYGVKPLENTGTLVKNHNIDTPVNHYVMYLDGINQGSYQYLPEVERFLDALAIATPDNVAIVKGIMPYSVTNKPLTENRLLSFLWRMIDSMVVQNPSNPIGFIINARNVVSVAVSADPRYGPIQNQGLAQVLYNSLLSYGYPVGSEIPVTLVGYSGGGQMSMGAVTFLKRTIKAPITVISIAGVISGNTGTMVTEHLYHLVGDKDSVEKVGAIIFPGRWPFSLLSNWNFAKRRGKISFISLGPVGHNMMGGPMGDHQLPNGKTHLQQTVDIVTGILLENWEITGLDPDIFKKSSNYELYKKAPFNQAAYYPVKQTLNPELYQPVGNWIGRLILPKLSEREQVQGVLFEIYHADSSHQHRVGQIVNLRWDLQVSSVKERVKLVTQDVNFIDQVKVSQSQGNIHPERINSWSKVDPLESMAGARPQDDVIVVLKDPVVLKDTGLERPSLYIQNDPIEITGRFYALVRFIENLGNDFFLVRHYSPASQQFNGPEERVYLPSVIANRDGALSSINQDLEQSPVNASGWYIFGQKNIDGQFVVQAIAPYQLFSLTPDLVISGQQKTLHYINWEYWKNQVTPQGQVKTIFLNPNQNNSTDSIVPESIWKEGDRALLMHVYGGIGGPNGDNTPFGIYFGHFAYGIATVVRDRLTQELRFNIEYRQIYTHNCDGIISGSLDWTRYSGDRQFGWLGSRPFTDILIKFDPLTQDYDFDSFKFSPLDIVINELDIMTARYRVGDGTGTTFVSAINSCSQDSSQALYLSLRRMLAQFELNPLLMKWLRENPHHEQTERFLQLATLVASLESILTAGGKARKDWRYGSPTLGRFTEETPLKTLSQLGSSWRSLLPRLINDKIAMIFLQLGAYLWILRTHQVGGHDPTLKTLIPTDFWFGIPKLKNFEYD
ncbi:Yip1 family protein [Planktothrix agardhii]|uniref:Yip1 family protein n=1 Tax=Planktothrix agardhii TaxID=1160 RepID=UPI001D09BED0|nr:peptidase [Planktothrix agardhii]MCB8785329.1 peptidase [Planktothrix agardhii 1025]MCF3612950.1 peptidase [Planktothrix agardhii 1027]MCF3646833.1 peptidase [Planktothrix agardhii 1026]